MTSSGKKKRARAQAFKKAKLRVGKPSKPPANFTPTAFAAKQIVVASQSSLQHDRRTETTSQLLHHLSLLSHHSPSTRRDSLAFLADNLASPPAVPPAVLLPRLAPIILDPSDNVRAQLLRLLACLRPADVRLHMPLLLLHVWSAMSHIDPDVRRDSSRFLSWALATAPALTLAAGGWARGLATLAGCLQGCDAGVLPRHLGVVDEFLVAGIGCDAATGKAHGEEGEEAGCEGGCEGLVARGGLHWSVASNLRRAGVGDYRHLALFVDTDDGGDGDGDGDGGSGGIGAQAADRAGRWRWCVETRAGRETVARLRGVLAGLTKEGGDTGRRAGRVLSVLNQALSQKAE